MMQNDNKFLEKNKQDCNNLYFKKEHTFRYILQLAELLFAVFCTSFLYNADFFTCNKKGFSTKKEQKLQVFWSTSSD